MPKFGRQSQSRLDTCHKDLQLLFNEVVKGFDCSVLCGERTRDEQDKAYHEGRSKLKYPQSKHNTSPSIAVDVAPYPIDWDDKERFYFFAGYVKGIASQLGIKIRWGGDWDNDTQVHDQSFMDLPHFELEMKR